MFLSFGNVLNAKLKNCFREINFSKFNGGAAKKLLILKSKNSLNLSEFLLYLSSKHMRQQA